MSEWQRRQTRDPAHVDHRARAEALAGLLRRVLNEFQFVIDEHGECASCQTDLDIFNRKAADLGVVAERVLTTSRVCGELLCECCHRDCDPNDCPGCPLDEALVPVHLEEKQT